MWNFLPITFEPVVRFRWNFARVIFSSFHCHLKGKVKALESKTKELLLLSQIDFPSRQYIFYPWLQGFDPTLKVAMKWGKVDPGKISAKSDNWFKSYGQKVEKRHFLGTGYPWQITRFLGTRILPITRFLLPGSWQAYSCAMKSTSNP